MSHCYKIAIMREHINGKTFSQLLLCEGGRMDEEKNLI